MTDWQHEIRNQLNVVVYACSGARDALAEGRAGDAEQALSRIDEAVAACVTLLAAWDQTLHDAAPPGEAA